MNTSFKSIEETELTATDLRVLKHILKAGRPLTAREIYDSLEITRYYIYEVVAKLKNLELIDEIGQKPKLFSSHIGYLAAKIKKYKDKLHELSEKIRSGKKYQDIILALDLSPTETDILKQLFSDTHVTMQVEDFSDQEGLGKKQIERLLKGLALRGLISRRKIPGEDITYKIEPFNRFQAAVLSLVNSQADSTLKVYQMLMDELNGTENMKSILAKRFGELEYILSPDAWTKILLIVKEDLHLSEKGEK